MADEITFDQVRNIIVSNPEFKASLDAGNKAALRQLLKANDIRLKDLTPEVLDAALAFNKLMDLQDFAARNFKKTMEALFSTDPLIAATADTKAKIRNLLGAQ